MLYPWREKPSLPESPVGQTATTPPVSEDVGGPAQKDNVILRGFALLEAAVRVRDLASLLHLLSVTQTQDTN